MKNIKFRQFMLDTFRPFYYFVKPFYVFIKRPQSKLQVINLIKQKRELWLELGAGKKGENGWITVDIENNPDILWDLRLGLPFPNESISKIYSSHFFEHLSYKEGQKFFGECLRVLVPFGTFSICVPNARIYIEAYLKGLSIDDFCIYKPAFNYTTKIDYVNYIAYMHGHHKYMFDEENLFYILKSVGFRNVRLRKFDPELDLKERDYESIYFEAEK